MLAIGNTKPEYFDTVFFGYVALPQARGLGSDAEETWPVYAKNGAALASTTSLSRYISTNTPSVAIDPDTNSAPAHNARIATDSATPAPIPQRTIAYTGAPPADAARLNLSPTGTQAVISGTLAPPAVAGGSSAPSGALVAAVDVAVAASISTNAIADTAAVNSTTQQAANSSPAASPALITASSSGYADGSAGAPAGTPELPTLFSGDAVRPPWEVAGVDYYVGVPTGLTLKTPTGANMPAGASFSASSNTITVTGTNVTISGFDFSGGGGVGIYIEPSASGTAITDNLFVDSSSTGPIPVNIASGATNTYIAYNTINGGGASGNSSFDETIYNPGGGGLTVEYNYIYNTPGRFVSVSGGALTYQYNLLENGGWLSGVHLNFLQDGPGTLANPQVAFNTILQDETIANGEGFQLYVNGTGSIVNANVSNNTIITSSTVVQAGAKGPALSYVFHAGSNSQYPSPATGIISNNYVNVTSAYGVYYPGLSGFTASGNINLVTGSSFDAAPSAPTPANDTALTPENKTVAINVLANDTDASATINPASVAITAAATHGSTSVNPSTGAVTYTPTSGYYGTDTFKYTVADSSGHTSAPATVTVTVDAPPTTVADAAQTTENQSVTIPVLTNDTDIDGTISPAAVAVTGASAHGTTTVNATTGAITYTPAAGFYGTDIFNYTVADTLGVTSSPAAVTVTVNQPAVSGYADGSSSAPAGAAQLPTILASYATRPAWKVAGVDYAVGVPAGTTLKDPTVAGNLPSGASYNAPTNTVTVTGNNVTLNGLDFSLHGGIQLSIQSSNVTVENSNFALGASEGSITSLVRATSSAGNVTFLANTFNGNDVAVTAQASALISILNQGTVTFEYNYFHDTGGDVIDFSGGPQADIVQYNLFANVGVNTAHADTLQWYDSQITSGEIGFNTVYQNVPQPGPGNGALTVLSEGPTATMTNMMVNNDTVIQTAAVSSSGATTGNFTTGFYADLGGTASGVTIHDLYIDPTGANNYTGMWLLPTGYYGTNLATPTAISGVTNMVTGAIYTTLPTAYHYYVAPAANGVSPSLNDIYGITASQTSGTINLGGTLTFTVNLDEAFTLSGTPTLKLNDGGVATYVSGSGSNAWTFRYTVGAGDTAVPTLAITGVNLPNGSSAVDAVGNTASLSGEQVSFAGLAVNPSSGIACFLKGTKILTSKGEIPVELLTIGDLVVTHQGRLSPIKWIGHRSYDAPIVHANPQLRPVRVHANALANGIPRRDLYVSPLHALFIDGILIPAAALVNGVSIDRTDAAAICYYHVELAAHDVIFADGAPAESFIDFDSRSLFANAQEYVALYPDELQVQLKPCVPRVEDGWLVDSVWRRLADRAAPMRAQLPQGTLSGHVERIGLNCVEGWVVDTTNPDTPVELEILVAGTRSGRIIANQYRTDLDRAGYSGGRCAFSFIFPPGQVRGDAIVVRRISDRTELPKHRTAECGPAIESRIRKQAA